MARPSQDVDKELLRVGRELYPALGCTGLSVRRLAQEAGANPAMVHYHFGSKEGFLRALFEGMYEDMFAGLTHEAAGSGDALQRLRGALRTMAHFVREHRPFIARVWGDAQAGEAVAQEFARANGPRHLQLLMALTLEAEQAGQLAPAAPLQRLVFLMGSVIAPLMIAGAATSVGLLPKALAAPMKAQALSDDAIEQRIAWALASLSTEHAS